MTALRAATARPRAGPPRWPLALALALAAAACGEDGGGDGRKKRDRPPPLVTVEQVASARFVERIDAVGTARANEQVALTSPVTERIVRLAFDDGDYVRRGQTVAVLRAAQQTAELSEAAARAREAESQLVRLQALKERGFATNRSVDQQQALVQQARAQMAASQAEIGDRVVTAPFSGWASLRNISPGTVVSAGSEIVTISDTSTIKLDFPVPETMLSAVRVGQPIQASAAAYPEARFRGSVSSIDAVVDANTRAVTVRARLPNPERLLKPGMLLTVTVESSERVSPAVPELAVVGEGDNRFVFTLAPDKTAKRTLVETGLRSDGRIEILKGLSVGQRVVTEGVVKLTDGVKVRVAGERAGGDVGPGTPAAGNSARNPADKRA